MNNHETYTSLRTNPSNPDFQLLIQALDTELSARYQAEQEKFDHHNKLKDDVKAIVVYGNQGAVACGCYRPMDEAGVVEIKRMYVKLSERGKGLSEIILKELLSWAKEEKFLVAKLETGIKQPEAISLYTKYGFKRIPNYGPYSHIPESVCMEIIL